MFYVNYDASSNEYMVLHTDNDDNNIYANYKYELDAIKFASELNKLS